MTINRNGPDELGRAFQAKATEIQANLLDRKRAQGNDKTSDERRRATMMRQPQQHSSQKHENAHQMATMSRATRRPNGHAKPEVAPAAEAASSQPMGQQEVWTSTEDLFWDHMREVQNKWNTLKLNDDIWAKLIYFEQNRRLAKAYVSTPVLTIDGSINGLDGFRIGLSGIENSYRDLDSIACLRAIGHGIELKIDQQGNILIRKLVPVQRRAQAAPGCSVWVKEWPSARSARDDGDGDGDEDQSAPAKHQRAPLGTRGPATSSSNLSNCSQHSSSSFSSSSGSSPLRSSLESRDRSSAGGNRHQHAGPTAADWRMQEISDPGRTYKLFDMQRFRAQLDRSRRRAERNLADGTTTTPIDWRQCVSIISFNRRAAGLGKRPGLNAADADQERVLGDPCWLMLINIIAIDMLKSSVCDAGSHSPQSQTSSLINRHQSDSLRSAARKLLPPLPASNESLVAASWQGHPSQCNQQTASSLEQPEFKSDRLRRLNGRRHGQELATTTATSLSATSKRLDNNNGSASGSSRSSQQQQQQQQQQEGSIYTTFTGKYLDKHHKRRIGENRTGQSSANRFELERGPHLVMSKLNERKWGEAGDSRHSMAPTQRDRRSGGAANGLNPSAPGERMPGLGKQLTHSLSAFDLSHGLKLNFRSINTIRMNFRDDVDDNDQDDDQDDYDEDLGECGGGQGASEHARGLQMLAERRPRAQEDLFSKLRLNRSQQRKASKSVQEAGSEWVDLAKKYAPDLEQADKPLDDEFDENKDQSFGANKSDRQNEAPGESSASTLQQNKSRSSIASSSSGCADNDYFNSQSSPSSMSSSITRSNGAEELASQPASSSGINSASSDHYERCVSTKRPTDDGIELGPTEEANTNGAYRADQEPARRSASASSRPRSATTRLATATANTSEPARKEATSHHNRRRDVRKVISLSRGNNGKSLGMGSMEPVFACEDCQHLDECNGQVQCDCGVPTCDRMMFALEEQTSCPHEICDCYCDCLFHQPSGQTASGTFAHPDICQDEALCDCGAAAAAACAELGRPLDLAPAPDDVEEPIYDHLPRFGLADRSISKRGAGGKRADAPAKSPMKRSASRLEQLTEDSDGMVRMMASTLNRRQTQLTRRDSTITKSTSATNLKRAGAGGWLAGSRYMKLLPRFMAFGSKPDSYSNRKLEPLDRASTIDRDGQPVSRFTRSRSSQNLA